MATLDRVLLTNAPTDLTATWSLAAGRKYIIQHQGSSDVLVYFHEGSAVPAANTEAVLVMPRYMKDLFQAMSGESLYAWVSDPNAIVYLGCTESQ